MGKTDLELIKAYLVGLGLTLTLFVVFIYWSGI